MSDQAVSDARQKPSTWESPLAKGLRLCFTPEQLDILGTSRVGIAGAGGLGSNVAVALVRSGIRNLVVVDGDCVEASNLNRQAYWPEDVGRPKVEALYERLAALEPDLVCQAQRVWIDAGNACALFRGCAVVVEALDSATFKAELCALLLESGFFVVGASGLAGYGLPLLGVRRLGQKFACVGDFCTGVSKNSPVLAPRVLQAASIQADIVLSMLLGAAGE